MMFKIIICWLMFMLGEYSSLFKLFSDFSGFVMINVISVFCFFFLVDFFFFLMVILEYRICMSVLIMLFVMYLSLFGDVRMSVLVMLSVFLICKMG